MTNPDPFQKVTFRGRLMDAKTQAFLEAMEAKLGYQLTVLQGCYSNPTTVVSASAGTHDGGGVVDLAPLHAEDKVRVARELGAFAWHRQALPGIWGEHVHLGIRDHGRLAPAAQRQQDDFDAHPKRNGLANHATDPNQFPAKARTFVYPPKVKPTPPTTSEVTKARDALTEAHHALNEAIRHIKDADDSRTAAKGQLNDLRDLRDDAADALEKLPKR